MLQEPALLHHRQVGRGAYVHTAAGERVAPAVQLFPFCIILNRMP